MKKGCRIIAGILILVSMLVGTAFAGARPAQLRIGYSDYDPLSLVLKKFGWLNRELARDSIRVQWIFCPTGAFAMRHLDTHELDVAPSAGLNSLLDRCNGGRNQAIYVATRVQWLSLLVERDAEINSVRELKGKTIAVSPNSASYFLLLTVLHEFGLTVNDVRILPAEHAHGIAALILKRVDAWVGPNPWASQARLEHGAREIYHNNPFSTFVLLNISEEFARNNPDIVTRIVKSYEKARSWALTHADEMVDIYASEAKVSYQVSKLALSQNDFSDSRITPSDIQVLKGTGRIFMDECVIRHGTNIDQVIDRMVDDRFVKTR